MLVIQLGVEGETNREVVRCQATCLPILEVGKRFLKRPKKSYQLGIDNGYPSP